MSQHHHCVQIVPIFNHLDEESQALISSKAQHIHYHKGDFIYHAGDVSHSLYIVHKGMVRLFHMNEDGKEQLNRILMAGDYLGEWTLFHPNQVHSHYAQVVKDSEICVIHREDFQSLLVKYPQVSLELLSSLSRRLQEADKHSAQLSIQSVTSRLALFIAEQDVSQENSQGSLIHLELPKKDIASYLGMSPETLSRSLRRLEDQGYLKMITPKQLLVFDMDALILADD